MAAELGVHLLSIILMPCFQASVCPIRRTKHLKLMEFDVTSVVFACGVCIGECEL